MMTVKAGCVRPGSMSWNVLVTVFHSSAVFQWKPYVLQPHPKVQGRFHTLLRQGLWCWSWKIETRSWKCGYAKSSNKSEGRMKQIFNKEWQEYQLTRSVMVCLHPFHMPNAAQEVSHEVNICKSCARQDHRPCALFFILFSWFVLLLSFCLSSFVEVLPMVACWSSFLQSVRDRYMTEEDSMMSYFGQRCHHFHHCPKVSTCRSMSSSTIGLIIRRQGFDVHCRQGISYNDPSLASSCGLLKRVDDWGWRWDPKWNLTQLYNNKVYERSQDIWESIASISQQTQLTTFSRGCLVCLRI